VRTTLGRVGVWSRLLRYNDDPAFIADSAAEVEALGYGALFIPDVGGDVIGDSGRLLAATSTIPVVTGILNIWMHDPAAVTDGVAGLDARYGERFLLGLGASHAAVIDAKEPGRYSRPYSKMVDYLDALDAQERPLPPSRRILAALGPRMLGLSRARAGGAHPYLMPSEHTRAARETIGEERLLAPELSVLLEPDPSLARERARAFVAEHLKLPNYTRTYERLGFGADDLAGHGSDRLLRAVVAVGDEQDIADRVAEHHAAGADHVAIHVMGLQGEALREQWRRLADVLL
jgi:probable F420-dependent oxidoreductase